MQTVLYIMPMTVGDEVEVRRMHDRFPAEALERGIGVERVVAFIGSGYYALELTVSSGEFQEQFHAFLAAPEIASFFQELSAHVQQLPSPTTTTAEMPLATAMLLWQRSSASDATTV